MTMIFGDCIEMLAVHILTASALLTSIANTAAEPRKRSIGLPWSSKEVSFGGNVAFRIMSEVHLATVGKSFLLEEWGSVEPQNFRLDITDKSSGKTGSLLNNVKDKERIFYEPFKCSAPNDLKEVIDEDLVKRFPATDPWIIAGAASIWLYASKIGSFKFIPADPDATIKGKVTERKYVKKLNVYNFEPTPEFPYGLRLNYRKGKLDNGIEYPDDLVSMSVVEVEPNATMTSESKILLFIRLLEVESLAAVYNWEYKDVFELPLAFGCQKRSEFSSDGPIDLHSLDSIPEIIELDVVVSQIDQSAKVWKSHTTSLRILAGQLDLGDNIQHKYMTFETTFHGAAASGDSKGVKRASLKRTKRLWDLSGHNSLDGFFYDIDLKEAKCVNFGYDNVKYSSNFIFPVTSQAFNLQPSNTTGQSTAWVGISLDPDQLNQIFTETDGFHLLRESSPSWSSRELIMEKQSELSLLDIGTGRPIITAPTSLVRKYVQADFGDSKSAQELTSRASSKDIESTIYLFSKGRDELLMKLKFVLIERKFINGAYFHRGLNIDPCLTSAEPSSVYSAPEVSTFRISYPLDALASSSKGAQDEIPTVDFDEVFQCSAYEQILRGIHDVSSRAIEVDPLRISNLKIEPPDLVSEDSEIIVSGHILDFPYLLGYRKADGYKLSSGPDHSVVVEVGVTERGCAESCGHYNCMMFSYCLKSGLCQLGLSSQTSQDIAPIVADPDCGTYMTVDEMQHRVQHRSAAEVLSELKQDLSLDQSVRPLKLKIEGSDATELVPSSIEINSDSMSPYDELARDLVGEVLASKDGGRMDGQSSEAPDSPQDKYFDYKLKSKSLRLEFELFSAGRKFKNRVKIDDEFPLQLANHVLSLKSCKRLCAEVDCRSFSYCSLDQTCQVSQLHSEAPIERQSEPAELCSIHRREYLSKFYRSGAAVRPPSELPKALAVSANKDCAALCMDSGSSQCRSFVLCPSDQEQSLDCYLNETRQPEPEPTVTAQDSPCELYSRSYVADFVRFRGKSLPDSSSGASVVVLKGLVVEDCAGRCANLGGSCEAFHVCRGSSSSPTPLCALSMQSIESKLREGSRISANHLIDNPSCTSFIMSSSQLSQRIQSSVSDLDDLLSSLNLADSKANSQRRQAEQQTGSSIWFSLSIVTIGMATGYLIALAVCKRRRLRKVGR